VVMVAVSYLTEEPSYEKIKGLTYGTATEKDSRRTRESWGGREVVASVVVLFIILCAYLYFSG
jgi:solute:Na+ symporter, SSS family